MTLAVLIVVPARAGSKGIPRKNVRLLAGKPLVAHALERALRVPGATTVVTTDDDEVVAVAAGLGVQIVMRPPELAGDDVTLDPVVEHAWREMERRERRQFDIVMTIQPTSPLLRPESLDASLAQLLNEGLDSCVSVTDARHLYWTQHDGKAVPAYESRANRQQLPPLWRETGGVVVSRRALLEKGLRIGGRIGLIAVSPAEGLDIDVISDWLVAEELLTSPRLIMRVIGNRQVGLGHAYRCASIARRLFVPELTCVVDEGSDEAAQLFKSQHFPVLRVRDDDEFVRLVRDGGYDLVINDILDTSREYIAALSGNNSRVVVTLEDLGLGAETATLTINAIYEYSTPRENQRVGWQFADLREEFLSAALRPLADPGDYVLVTFGGTDPSALTERAIRACAIVSQGLPRMALEVVVGPGNERLSAIEELVAAKVDAFASVNVRRRVNRMSDVMQRARLAITSNGRTVYELASLGIPMITVSQNRREAAHTFARMSGGAIDLGLGSALGNEEFVATVAELVRDEERLRGMRECLMKYDLRRGMDRVVTEIKDCYRGWLESRAASMKVGV